MPASSPPEMPFERVKTALKDIGPNAADQVRLIPRIAGKLRRPFRECARAIGDRGKPQGRHVVPKRHRAFEHRVAAEEVVIRQAHELFSDVVTVLQIEISDATNLVAGQRILDPAVPDARMPFRQSVEIPHTLPHPVRGGIDH